MNLKQILIVIAALIALALIAWHELPLEFPWMFNAMMLLWKSAAVLLVAAVAFIFAGRKKKQTGGDA